MSEIRTIHHQVDPTSRLDLQRRYLELTRELLPIASARHHWSVTEDHCFMRILLDQLFQDCWYHHLNSKQPAYRQLNLDQLKACIRMGEQLLSGDTASLAVWNRESLRWRGKLS